MSMSTMTATAQAPSEHPAQLTNAEFCARLDSALALYDDDKLLQASRALASLSEVASPEQRALFLDDPASSNAKTTRSSSARDDPFAAKGSAYAKRARNIRAQMAEVDRIYASLRSDDGWTTCYKGESTTVEYRAESDKKSHTMRAIGTIRAPLRNVAALLNEPDLFPELFWFVTNCEVLGSKGRFRRAAAITLFAPPPLYNREVHLFGFAVDGLTEDNCVLIVSRDLRPDDGLQGPSSDAVKDKRTVKAEVNFSMFELRPVSPGVTRVRLIANSDPKLPYVPMILVNWGSRTIMRFTLRLLEARARNIEALPHHERLSNPVYSYIDDRLVEYWKSKGYSEEEYRSSDAVMDNLSDDFDDTTPEAPSKSSILAALSSATSVSYSSFSLRRMLSRDRGSTTTDASDVVPQT